MPTIIGQAEQQAALKEIGTLLKALEKTNQFLVSDNDAGQYTISFTAEDGTKYSATAQAGHKSEIDGLVLNYKATVRNRVETLAKEHRIALSIEDKLILDVELTSEEKEELEARELAELEAAEADNEASN